jgi:hypothetical protein
MAKQHNKPESQQGIAYRSGRSAEERLSRSRTFVYRKAMGAVGLSLLMVPVFGSAALAMPADAPPDGSSNEEAHVSQPVGGQERAEIQHLGEAEPAGVAGVFGGQVRAEIQHLGEAEPQPSTNFEPARRITPSSGGRELEIVLFLSGTVALGSLGALLWFRRQTIKPA